MHVAYALIVFNLSITITFCSNIVFIYYCKNIYQVKNREGSDGGIRVKSRDCPSNKGTCLYVSSHLPLPLIIPTLYILLLSIVSVSNSFVMKIVLCYILGTFPCQYMQLPFELFLFYSRSEMYPTPPMKQNTSACQSSTSNMEPCLNSSP